MARYTKRGIVIFGLSGLVAAVALAAAGGYMLAGQTEQWEPVPPLVDPVEIQQQRPADVIVLFGESGLGQWVNTKDKGPASWSAAGGVMTVNKAGGNIETRRKFRNFRLHLEWRVPANISGSGQGRGNSGVFLAATGTGDQGYEVQILDPWQNPTYVNGQAGAVYKQHAPLANPGRKPGEWQVYDIAWTAPRFGADGTLKSPARVTVVFNGVVVQDNVALRGQTTFIGQPEYQPHGPAPIMLQAHADKSEPISFRNVWVSVVN